ncbi:MAG: PD-(D/E)XK nuclease family protein [Verrucomicrobiota bacterium]
MSIPPANIRRHFLGWSGPLLAQAVPWLTVGWTAAAGPLDLSRTLVLVPTRQSGRRLREALAEHAGRQGGAVFPPRVYTPDAWLAEGSAEAGVASRLEVLLAWADLLLEIDLAEVAAVLPVAPPQRDFAWAWRLAETFFRLQTQLGEGGLGFADVATRTGADFSEADRWRQLAWLEEQLILALARLGLREPHAARRAWAAAPSVPEEIERIVLLGAPDPLPLALEALTACAARMPVEVLVFAPEAEAEAFDGWGRPVAAAWEKRELALPDFEACVQVCADPASEAEQAAALAARYPQKEADGLIAIGSADPETLPLLERSLARAGLTSYNPEGRPRRGEQLYALLAALGREPTFDAVAALARCPDFLAALATRLGPTASIAQWLRELDRLHERHLPADLADAQRAARGKAELSVGLDFVAELYAAVRGDAFPHNAVAALGAIFGHRRFDLARDEDARAVESAEAWRHTMFECAQARERFPRLGRDEWWEVALRMFGDSRHAEEKPPGALDLQGWLELLWEDAPHLVVVGLNDGLVPEAIVGDAFLPEALRERLGLKTNAARFARDAYLLQAMAAWRQPGTLDVMFVRVSAGGDPQRPSRLLLRCADAELPERIAFLFRAPESARSGVSWTRAWQLEPRRIPAPPAVSVTALRMWLACPFRFYLTHVLKMEPVEPAKSELDARDFGTLCHTALEAMALEPALRDCTDEKVLREFLLSRFDLAAHRIYGENHTLPLVVQLESARQRLGRAAAIRAQDRAEGWVIERAEWKLSLDLGGLEIRGKIDRIDRNESTGAFRVLDYKTSDTGVSPQKAHLRPLGRNEEGLPEWMCVELEGRTYVWADLQLPLYLRALEREPWVTGLMHCAYFNLPKAVGETGMIVWDGLTRDLRASAAACADGVAAAIRGGEFWPPKEIPADRDPFATLFHHGAEDSVRWQKAEPAPPTQEELPL